MSMRLKSELERPGQKQVRSLGCRETELEELRSRMDRALCEAARGESTDGEEFLQGMLDELDAGDRRIAR